MKKFVVALFGLVTVASLAACSNTEKDGSTSQSSKGNEVKTGQTVEIKDAHGTVEVPVNPKNVVALDSRSFETLESWGIKLAAAPKDVIPKTIDYKSDASIPNIGNHREPNLEVLAAAQPDVVIVGQRFGDFYDEIKKLVPDAAVIDLNIDVSENTKTPGENLMEGLKQSTTDLGEIFDKKQEADALNTELDQKIADVKAAYNGEDTVLGTVVTGGSIGFSAPHSGRIWGPLYEILDWEPALEVDHASSDHKGDEISVEAIAQSNPDWIMVMDRDADISEEGEFTPAKDVIENAPALQNTTAIKEKHVIYAPVDTYTNESIGTYIEILDSLEKAFEDAK